MYENGEVFRENKSAVITDGDPATCVSLLSNVYRLWFRKKITLNVDLSTLRSIFQVEIFQEEVSINWSVYISTTKRRENSTQCRRTISSPELQRFTCADHGRFVILSLGYEYKDSSVCEVNVTGCAEGKFGEDCNKQCPENCVGKICNILDGKCTRCSDGWKGDNCNQRKQKIQETGKCAKGYCGDKSIELCKGRCLKGTACNAVTGYCGEGCAPGWRNKDCSEECTEGYFGDNCTKLCKGRCMNGAACNAVTGYCDEGCAPGWRNKDCSEVCPNGFFGTQCAQRCNLSCDPTTGFYSGTVTEILGKSEQYSEGSNAIVSGLVVALVVSVLMNVGLLMIYWKRGILNGKQTSLKEAPLYANAEFEGPVNEQPGRGDNSTRTNVYYETLNDRTRDQDTQNYSTLEN